MGGEATVARTTVSRDRKHSVILQTEGVPCLLVDMLAVLDMLAMLDMLDMLVLLHMLDMLDMLAMVDMLDMLDMLAMPSACLFADP